MHWHPFPRLHLYELFTSSVAKTLWSSAIFLRNPFPLLHYAGLEHTTCCLLRITKHDSSGLALESCHFVLVFLWCMWIADTVKYLKGGMLKNKIKKAKITPLCLKVEKGFSLKHLIGKLRLWILEVKNKKIWCFVKHHFRNDWFRNCPLYF